MFYKQRNRQYAIPEKNFQELKSPKADFFFKYTSNKNVLFFRSGSGYGAMMASYLTGSGHVPDSLKHLFPEMRKYWGATAHSKSKNGYGI